MIEFINIDIYLNCIVVAAGIDVKEFDKLYYDNVTKFTNEEYEEIRRDIANENSCNGETVLLENGNIFVFIRKGHEREELYVIHELFHAVNKLLCRAGVNHDADAEPWAYLMGWLANEYFNRLDDFENKNK
jgi:hypothetical protein